MLAVQRSVDAARSLLLLGGDFVVGCSIAVNRDLLLLAAGDLFYCFS